ncbi:MAG: hypothetical protein K6E98_04230 [Lachnospiraceae bacterium]|nr:hypothetical protein [Lachnospiraceae bacterium]
MSTVVYLANQQIQVIEGKRAGKGAALIKRYLTLEAPEGSVINGVVTDEDGFSEFIKAAWKEAKLPVNDVILIINSTKFVGRTLELPVLNEKTTYEYIAREFAEVGKEVDQIFSYIPIGKTENKMNKYYVEGVESDYVRDCVSLFLKAGLKISAVYSDGSNLITLCGATSAKKHQTFVLLVADAMTLTTILWVNGAFNYGNTVRCFFDQGTPEYAADVARSVSQLIQFLKSNQSEAVLESIEIAGIDPADLSMYAEAISEQGTDAPVSLYSLYGLQASDPGLQRYLHTISGFYGKYKTQDFLSKAMHHKKASKHKGLNDTVKLFIPAFIVFIIMAIVFTVMYIVKISKNRELQALNEFNESPEVMMNVSLFDAIEQRTNFLLAQYNAIKEIDEDILTYPCGNTEVMQVFRTCAAGYAEIELGAFDARNGTLSIEAKAAEVERINKFIKRLMEDPTFSDVNYTGYDYVDSDNMWKINITTTLAESVGRGDVAKLLEESRKRTEGAAGTEEEMTEEMTEGNVNDPVEGSQEDVPQSEYDDSVIEIVDEVVIDNGEGVQE